MKRENVQEKAFDKMRARYLRYGFVLRRKALKKEQGRKIKSSVKNASGRKNTERKKVVKMRVTGNTEILDLDVLEAEIKQPKKKKAKDTPEKKTPALNDERLKNEKKESKSAAKAYGEKMPQKPVTLSDETLELLELDELLALEAPDEKTQEPQEKRAPKKKDDSYLTYEPKKKESKAPQKDDSYLTYEPKRKTDAGKKIGKRSGERNGGGKKKRSGGSDFSFIDVIIALTGVLVLFVGVMAYGIYHNAAETENQVAAMAEVGEKMETIGYAGIDMLVAVADARIAAQELINQPSVEDASEVDGGYAEKELVSKVNVSLKLSSVQKDLKIKFTNKESGKLIGNQAFTVKIDGPESMTKTDDDKDGIIYINSIKAGEYTVMITAPEEIDGAKAAGVTGLITVKDTIEYKKIDVTDEVKKESEINTAKEDTAVAMPVESVATDTVEWVESTKTPLEGSGSVTYEEIKKSDIPDPSTTALLDMIWASDGENGAYLMVDTVKLAQNAAPFADNSVKVLEKGEYFTQDEIVPVTESAPQTSGISVTSVSISGGGDYYVGETVTLRASAETEGDGSLLEGDYQWSGARGSGATATFAAESAGDYNVTVTVMDVQATTLIHVMEKPELKVTNIAISGSSECTVGDSVTLTASVETNGEGSLSDSDYSWSGASGSGKNATFSANSAGSYDVSVTVKGVTESITIHVQEKTVEATVSGVSVATNASRVEIGKSAAITATVSMSDGSNYNGTIEWSASGGQISGSGASVTLSGNAAQKVKVTAKAGGKENSVEVEFYDPNVKVNKISIPGSVSVVKDGTIALSLDVQPSDARDKSVEWKVTEGKDVASVDGNGTVKGVKTGTAKIQAVAKDGSNIASNICTVTVTSNVSVSLEAPGTLAAGGEKQLKYSTTGEIEAVEWRVSDEKIATVDQNGKVKAVAIGKVKVTVKVKGKDGTKVESEGELTVTAADVGEIKLEPASISCKVGEKKTIKATVTSTGSKVVTWKSDDESIVKIVESKDESCVIEALKAGKTTITATSKENKDKTARVEVTVELKDGTAPLKDKNGNQLYYKSGSEYKEATAADYYKYDVFYRKKDTNKYRYTGWQTIDGKRYYFDKNGVPVTGDQIIQGMKYSFQSDGSLKVNGTMGIDISKHNGNIDWNAVKNAGVNYVILRCGYRGSATGVLVEDEKFRSNIQGAQAAGLKVGIYFFSQAVSEREAIEEASLAISLIRNYKITYPVYMDVEAANGRADGLDAGTRTQIIKAFCETIRNSGYTAGVYANKTWLSSKMNVGSLGSYKIWLAQYAATPTYSGRYEMWQYSSTGKIAGISGNVDLNISYMSY